jgi:histidine triad (HIT) family protein
MKFWNDRARGARRTEDLRKLYFIKLFMENCIFCKIVKKEIPASIIYEDQNFLAFLDIQPVSDGHILIVLKKHIVWMQDTDDETIAEIFILAKKLMLAIKKGIKCDYVQVSVVGKDVPHFHIHLIPRYFGDGLPQFPTKKYVKEEAEEIAKKIISAL